MLKFLKSLKKLWWLVGLIVVFSICQVICDLMLPMAMGLVVDHLQNLSSQAEFRQTVGLSISMALFALGSAIFNVASIITAAYVTARLIERVRLKLFARINEYSFKDMNEFSITSLITRTTNDLTQVSNTLILSFKFLIYAPLVTLLAVILMFMQNSWQLVVITVIAVLVLVVIIALIVKYVLPRYRSIQEKTDKVNLLTRENLEGLRVVRAYNAETLQEEKFEVVNEDLTDTVKFSTRCLAVILPSIQFIIGILTLLIAWVGAYLCNAEKLLYSQIAVFSQYAAIVLLGFLAISMIIVQMPRAMVCANRVNEIIDHSIAVVGPEVSPETEEVGTIEFKNVTFKYHETGEPALTNISFKVKKGETLAIIGATGSGKTTLINLMPRFFDPYEGQILIDGHDVKEYNLDDLYKKFGYVPQKGYLFHDSLLNNIKLGKPDATKEEVDEALDIAQATEFVTKLKDGYDFEISQGGKNVSGGQRQRLCIARALILKPEIFIFDDSFSALDYKTDKVLRGRIKSDLAGTTNVIVAQRVGTIIDADQILVLDNGKLVGKGKHSELLKNCAVYKEIALSQLSKEELEDHNGK